MVVVDEQAAVRFLATCNSYRVGAYWLSDEADYTTNRFKASANFETVVRRYRFNRDVRTIVFRMIERLEISFRARFAYTLGHAHLDPARFRNAELSGLVVSMR